MCALGWGLHAARDGFTIGRVVVADSHTERDSRSIYLPVIEQPVPAAVRDILEQEFTYLGRGRQTYAFLSGDGEWVLKVPRTDLFRPPFYLRASPWAEEQKRACEREKLGRWSRLVESWSIAGGRLRELCAVAYAHVGRSGERLTIRLRDALGRRWNWEAERQVWALQKRVELLFPSCDLAYRQGDWESAERMIAAYVDLVKERGERGVANKDRMLWGNYGWDGARALQIDIGTLYDDPVSARGEGIRRELEALKAWIGQCAPGLHSGEAP